MKLWLVDSETWSWRLLRSEESKLFFSVVCGGVGIYTVDFELNHSEAAAYALNGSQFLKKLAMDVRNQEESFRSRHVVDFHQYEVVKDGSEPT